MDLLGHLSGNTDSRFRPLSLPGVRTVAAADLVSVMKATWGGELFRRHGLGRWPYDSFYALLVICDLLCLLQVLPNRNVRQVKGRLSL